MTVFNFTLRAEDDRGAFSDRQFSIKVRNTLVDRYMIIDKTHAYTSIDLVNWTMRPDMGGSGCAYGGGNWLVWVGDNRYRMSPDGINWTQYTAQQRADGEIKALPGPIISKPVWLEDRWYAICGTSSAGMFVISLEDDGVWSMLTPINIGKYDNFNYPSLEVTTNGCLVINFHTRTSPATSVKMPMISFDKGLKWETAIKSTPAGYVNYVHHYSAQTVHRSSVLKFINGLWYCAISTQRSYYSTYNANSQGAKDHYVAYSHDLVNFTRCDTTSISLNAGTAASAMGGLINDIHYVNGVLVLGTSLFPNITAQNPSYFAYSTDGRIFKPTSMTNIGTNNPVCFMSQGKMYMTTGANTILYSSSNNGRTFENAGILPTNNVIDFAKI